MKPLPNNLKISNKLATNLTHSNTINFITISPLPESSITTLIDDPIHFYFQ